MSDSSEDDPSESADRPVDESGASTTNTTGASATDTDTDESASTSVDEDTDAAAEGETVAETDAAAEPETDADDLDELRRQVEEKYDFDNFTPADMAKMSADEWEAVFDSDTWITGPELLDRVEAEIKTRIARRDIFGVIERETVDGTERLLVYSDEGYATVSLDGSVRGEGGVLRDVEPVVAMCSMDEYEVAEPPENYQLPSPEAVPEQSGELGNLMLQIIAGMQLIGGIGLIGAWVFTGVDTLVAPVIGGLFFIVGIVLFTLVANARLSDRFRAEQYRDRLRAVEAGGFERPDLPGESTPATPAVDEGTDSRERETEGA